MTQHAAPGTPHADERLRRWRLILGGGEAADGIGLALSGQDAGMDGALQSLYDSDGKNVGMGQSQPNIARWLRDALERLNLRQMLVQPELLAAVEPDVHLVADLLALKNLMPGKTRETARL